MTAKELKILCETYKNYSTLIKMKYGQKPITSIQFNDETLTIVYNDTSSIEINPETLDEFYIVLCNGALYLSYGLNNVGNTGKYDSGKIQLGQGTLAQSAFFYNFDDAEAVAKEANTHMNKKYNSVVYKVKINVDKLADFKQVSARSGETVVVPAVVINEEFTRTCTFGAIDYQGQKQPDFSAYKEYFTRLGNGISVKQ